jgi:hypothetical protein
VLSPDRKNLGHEKSPDRANLQQSLRLSFAKISELRLAAVRRTQGKHMKRSESMNPMTELGQFFYGLVDLERVPETSLDFTTEARRTQGLMLLIFHTLIFPFLRVFVPLW